MKIIQLYQNKPSEGKEFEVLETYGVEKALRQCQDAGYDALFMPQLVDARIVAPADSDIWNTWYTNPSLRAPGRSQGNQPVVVSAHVPHCFSAPDNIKEAVNKGLVNYAGRCPQKNFKTSCFGG